MRRSLALFAIMLLLVSGTRAEDAIPPDTVVAVKHAAVFVRVVGPDWKATGSGFVVAVEKDFVLVATNYHVIAPPDYDKKPRLSPAELVKSFKVPTVTAVFDGGTKTELSAKAEIIAGDPTNDLAVLRITGLKNPPKPIEYTNPPKLAETMAVYTFGYPFGEALATGKGAPAITVGKGSVSSLRLDDDGELSVVQIDGALNPGNSGGPVVDAKGRLVGVAVATIRGGQNIGFAVPCGELGKLMKGRIDGFHVTATKGADGKLVVKAEVGVLDPTTAVRGVTMHYIIVPPKGAKPKPGESLEKQAGVKKVAFKVANGVAAGELPVEAAEGDLYVQAVPDGGAGAAGTSRIQNYALAAPKPGGGAVVLGPAGTSADGPGAGEIDAPAGWKEHTATNKSYKTWIPEKAKLSEKDALIGKPPSRLRLNALVIDAPGGVIYSVEQVIIPPPVPKGGLDRDAFTAMLRDVALGDAPGAKVTRESDTKMGKHAGKEFLIEKGASATRARAFVVGSSLYLLRVVGPRDQVESADSTTFLNSCRLQVPQLPLVGGPAVQVPAGPPPVIVGGRTDPEFKDPVPAGAVLVGLEVGLGKAGPNDVVKAVRAIYRTGDKESFGEWRGPTGADVVTEKVKVVAKTGYAVSGFSVRTGAGIFGLSVTFMKFADGKLDAQDTYESDWIGAAIGLGPVKAGGTADVPRAFIGKSNANTVSGIGLSYGETAKKEPEKKGPDVAVGPPMPPRPQPPRPPGPPGYPAGRGPRIQGGAGQTVEYRDHAPAGGVLVGFEFGLGKFGNRDIVTSLRPIYRVGDKDSAGEPFGAVPKNPVKVVAKPGYAVGAVSLRSTIHMDGLSVTFMKVDGDKLDPKDTYESEWVGGRLVGQPVKLGGDGTQVVGVLLKINAKDEVTGLGLVYTDTNKPGLDGPWPAGKPTAIPGFPFDPEFRAGGPKGSLLVGMEVGLGRFVNNPVVTNVRPIFRAGDKDTEGDWLAAPNADAVKENVKVVAKPGYAIGAITTKTGLGLDGFSVTFMKVVDGKLDPKDTYESEWVGGMGGGQPTKVGGDGTLVIGLAGRAKPESVTSLGLVLSSEKK